MKYVIRGLIAIIVLYVLAMMAGAWHFSGLLMQNANPHVCKTEHYMFCNDPGEVGLEFEDVLLKSRDGLALSAWFIAGKKGAPGVLLVHGRGATRREGTRYAPALHKAGFNLLMIDLRNSGASEKAFISMGFFERRDVKAGIDYLLNEKQVPKVGVFGFSMGGATSILAMAEDQRIAAGVFEGAFDSLSRILADRARIDYGLPAFPLVPLVELFYGWRGGFDAGEIRPIDRIADIAPRPVFIIHGTADATVPYHHGESLFAAAREPKEFWGVPEGGHTRAYNADKETADRRIPAFFEKHLE